MIKVHYVLFGASSTSDSIVLAQRHSIAAGLIYLSLKLIIRQAILFSRT